MNNYNFSMEKILEWRSTIEKDKMEGFGRLRRDLKLEQDRLLDLALEIQDTKLKSMKEIDIYKLQQYNLYRERIEEKIDMQKRKIEDIIKAIEIKRLELVEAQKDRSIMEKLKEKDKDKYKKKLVLQEQKELDEVAVLRHKELEVY